MDGLDVQKQKETPEENDIKILSFPLLHSIKQYNKYECKTYAEVVDRI